MEAVNGMNVLKGLRADRGGKASKTFGGPEPRTCARCSTILSRYNPSPTCSIHSTARALSAARTRRPKPEAIDTALIVELFKDGHSMANIARLVGASRSTIHKALA